MRIVVNRESKSGAYWRVVAERLSKKVFLFYVYRDGKMIDAYSVMIDSSNNPARQIRDIVKKKLDELCK